MEPEVQPRASAAPASGAGPDEPLDSNPYRPEPRSTHSIFIGSHGLRAGWSVLIAVIIYRLCFPILGTLAIGIYPGLENFDFTPTAAFFQELVPLLAMIAAGFVVSRIEQHSIFAYNLTGPQPALRFISGLAAGFAGLSALVGTLAMGGWLHFGSVALSGIQILKFGVLWALVFLLVGCVEEGLFRCYLQFTLQRGINFWWALTIVGVVCADLFLRSRGNPGIIAFIWMDTPHMLKGNAAWGVYAAAILGFVPCLLLYVKKIEGSNFWQAAWVTSTLFGFIHTGNGGENWIGVFAAAAIGFVFCVSVRPHRLGLVGHRLPRRMGLGGNLLLRRCRQRLSRAGPLPDHQPGWPGDLERRRRRPRRQRAGARHHSDAARGVARPLRAKEAKPSRCAHPRASRRMTCVAPQSSYHNGDVILSERGPKRFPVWGW